MDVEDISPGQNFAQKIDQTMDTCSTALVVIGPRWLQILNERASQNTEDYVRHEIESALTRKTRVIPVLVGGASATQLTGLPNALKDLQFHQAVELRDSSFKDDCERLAKSLGGSPIGNRRNWIVAITALTVLAVLLYISISKLDTGNRGASKKRDPLVAQFLATAKTQSNLKEYEGAYRSCTEAVSAAPTNRAVQNAQLDAAMLWLEHYNVAAREDQKVEELAAPQLTELLKVLYAGLSRESGKDSRSATILAHIGWAHWLNSHIAQAEFGSAAEDALRQALTIDPTNVYANAMLGNWLLQNRGNVSEAVQHIATALGTGQERVLVRSMQIGCMVYNSNTGVPAESMKALNDMRKNNEPLAEPYRHRFLSADLDPNYTSEFLQSVMTAVPPDEMWQTYLWLDDSPKDDSDSGEEWRQVKRSFFHAASLELAGKREEALTEFRALQVKLKTKGMTGTVATNVKNALTRLGGTSKS